MSRLLQGCKAVPLFLWRHRSWQRWIPFYIVCFALGIAIGQALIWLFTLAMANQMLAIVFFGGSSAIMCTYMAIEDHQDRQRKRNLHHNQEVASIIRQELNRQ